MKLMDLFKTNNLSLTERTQAKDFLMNLSSYKKNGLITWRNTTRKSILATIEKIDSVLSAQLSLLMHSNSFKALEGSWLGLENLTTMNAQTSTIKIRVLPTTKEQLLDDFETNSDFEESHLYNLVYQHEYGTPGGEPYSLLMGDYEFSHLQQEVKLLKYISQVSAHAFAPFISAISPKLFNVTSWEEVKKLRQIEPVLNSNEHIAWRQLRKLDSTRFLSLVLPRVLARLPYQATSGNEKKFAFNELVHTNSVAGQEAGTNFCWMNAAYKLIENITNSFKKYNWCTAIRGYTSGGKVSDLPLYYHKINGGEVSMLCPTEIEINDIREAELSQLGFLPLCYYKNTNFAVFFGGQTLHEPKKYDSPSANNNASISTRLPYIMATSRFTHYLKIIARDKIGSIMSIEELHVWLNTWILSYVNSNPLSGEEIKAKYPLAEAKVSVEEVYGRAGAYHIVAWLKPWLQIEELTTSMRLVADIPTALH